jgi:hypothetical protein
VIGRAQRWKSVTSRAPALIRAARLFGRGGPAMKSTPSRPISSITARWSMVASPRLRARGSTYASPPIEPTRSRPSTRTRLGKIEVTATASPVAASNASQLRACPCGFDW